MKKFLAGVWLGLKTLVNDPIGYLTNPVDATTKQYQQDLMKEGYTDQQIAQEVKVYHETGGVLGDFVKAYGQITSMLGDAAKSVGNITSFIGKNFTIILFIILLIIALPYVLPLLKLKKV